VIDRQIGAESGRAFNALTLHHNLFVTGGLDPKSLLARALNEKHARALNRTFQLVGLIHSPGDVAAVRNALRDGDARARSGAIEYLDNLLTGNVGKRVMVMVDEMPADERVRKGNVIHRTRARDVEDTLAQLLHDDDESIASAAILTVEERGLWTLADDLEHVLAHRDVRDQYVFEAASWALAAHRMPAERRRVLWQEPLPAAELANRLRQVPLFDFTHVDELFRLARIGRQVRHEAGLLLYGKGSTPGSLQFLLDGVVATTRDGGPVDVVAPAPLAFEEVLEGAPMRSTMTARERCVTLSLTSDEFLTLLAENVELAEGIFRMLIQRRKLATGHSLVHGNLMIDMKDRDAAGIRPVDRVLILQGSPLLAHATAAQLWRLSTLARPVDLEPGTVPLAKGEAAILTMLSGSVRVESADQEAAVATAGDVIGMYETLAGSRLDATVTVTARGTALRLERDDLFGLLADHTDLLQGIYSGLLRVG